MHGTAQPPSAPETEIRVPMAILDSGASELLLSAKHPSALKELTAKLLAAAATTFDSKAVISGGALLPTKQYFSLDGIATVRIEGLERPIALDLVTVAVTPSEADRASASRGETDGRIEALVGMDSLPRVDFQLTKEGSMPLATKDSRPTIVRLKDGEYNTPPRYRHYGTDSQYALYKAAALVAAQQKELLARPVDAARAALRGAADGFKQGWQAMKAMMAGGRRSLYTEG